MNHQTFNKMMKVGICYLLLLSGAEGRRQVQGAYPNPPPPFGGGQPIRQAQQSKGPHPLLQNQQGQQGQPFQQPGAGRPPIPQQERWNSNVGAPPIAPQKPVEPPKQNKAPPFRFDQHLPNEQGQVQPPQPPLQREPEPYFPSVPEPEPYFENNELNEEIIVDPAYKEEPKVGGVLLSEEEMEKKVGDMVYEILETVAGDKEEHDSHSNQPPSLLPPSTLSLSLIIILLPYLLAYHL